MSFAPGMTIGTNLRLVRLLAKGGMGSVWVAEHLALQTHVAVKFLTDGSLSDTAAGRFEQEAAAMARLKSPHVVQVFDYGLAPDGIPYISMDLLEGESLGSRLRRCNRLSTMETAAIVMQTCRALSRAHELDIVHRDIKPDNIFITDSAGELFVKVLDFGIAKKAGAGALGMTHSGMTIGTPLYMSPEQILSARSVTRTADLWAVTTVCYECLTGQVPFTGESYGGLCLAISAGRFEPPTRLRPELPASLDAWFARAFHADEKARFASAGDLARSFLAAALVSRSEAMSVPSGIGQRRQSYPSSGRLLTVQVAGAQARSATVSRELPADAQVPTQRSVVAEDSENLQISRPSLGGASLSSPPLASSARSSPSQGTRRKLAAIMVIGAAAIVAAAVTRGQAPGSGTAANAPRGVATATPVSASVTAPTPRPVPAPTLQRASEAGRPASGAAGSGRAEPADSVAGPRTLPPSSLPTPEPPSAASPRVAAPRTKAAAAASAAGAAVGSPTSTALPHRKNEHAF